MPTGGTKDIAAPKILENKSFPKNYSTNFNGNTIFLEFNEYFRFSSNEDVIITPKLKSPPSFITKGKKLEIELNNSLDENTTYTFNFLDAISDITEGNDSIFQYVFSTGDYLDSIAISGQVISAYTNESQENILVMLYEDIRDSSLINGNPKYYSLTDKNGNFTIKNIKKGEYLVGAINDKNKNFSYDLYDEEVAFLKQRLILPSNDSLSQALKLFMFKEENPKQTLLHKSYSLPGKLSFVLKHPLVSEIFIKEKSGKDVFMHKKINKNKDTVDYWLKSGFNIDSLSFMLFDGKTIIDSLNGTSIAPRKTKESPQHSLKIIPKNRSIIDLKKNFSLLFNVPIKTIDTSLIILNKDSVAVPFQIESIDSAHTHYNIVTPWKQGGNYELIINDGAFIDIYNYSIDSISFSFKTRKLDHYGILNLKVENYSSSMLFELINSKNQVYRSFKLADKNTIQLQLLEPDEYRLRVIYDSNNNSKWDTGSILKKKQAERTHYHDEKINIRSNWDLDLELKIPELQY